MSSERKDLIAISELLGATKVDPDNLTDADILRNILLTLDSSDPKLAQLKADRIPDSLALPTKLSSADSLVQSSELWDKLKDFNDLLRQDYTCRRQMLLSRLDCTVASFKWKASEGRSNQPAHKDKPTIPSEPKPVPPHKQSLNDLIHDKYERARVGLRDEPGVTISQLLAVRETDSDTLLNGVVSSSNVDCQVTYKQHQRRHSGQEKQLVNLKQVIIPEVPDRGGRPGEIRPPTKETFSQQRRGRGRGGHFGRR